MKISKRQLRMIIEASIISEEPIDALKMTDMSDMSLSGSFAPYGSRLVQYDAADDAEGQAQVDLAAMGNFPVSERFNDSSRLMRMYGSEVQTDLEVMATDIPGGMIKGVNYIDFMSDDPDVDYMNPGLIDFGTESVQNFLSKHTDPFRFAEAANEKYKYKYQRFPTKEQPLYFMSMFSWYPKNDLTQDQMSDLRYGYFDSSGESQDLVVKNNTDEGVVLIDLSVGIPDEDDYDVFGSGIFLKKIDSTIKLTNFLESHGIDPLGGR